MDDRLKQIYEGINAVEGVSIVTPLTINADGVVCGTISVTEKFANLSFDIEIYPQYPFQFHDVETIRFYNKTLLGYNHVNSDGSICVHTPHSGVVNIKLYHDLMSLKQWMVKYYINTDKDEHYDHIVVPENVSLSTQRCFLFTDVNHVFSKNDYGIFRFSFMSEGKCKNDTIITFIIQSFKVEGKLILSKWSQAYKNLNYKEGVYVFVENPPVINGRFIVESWADLEPVVSKPFLKYLHAFSKKGTTEIPILFGYKIPSGETHWQCAIINIKSFPIYVEKVAKNDYLGHLSDMKIDWVQTKNCSYNYFFGRGSLDKLLTKKKILILGLGAVGSIVATTLTRGGGKYLALVDYDIKEPENVCRSEYKFNSGLNNKVDELKSSLLQISPFVEVSSMPRFMDAVKMFINDNTVNNEIKSALEHYDLIFDCTADNDVAYILDLLQISSQIINLSVTNHASELICVTSPNAYQWLNEIFKILPQNSIDYYHPTGCWNPTFKASYNDVNVLVQYALKYINSQYVNGKQLRNFYINFDEIDCINIKINCF